MLKIFLVEDEFVVREGIKNNIDWEAHGYEFCGEASDGELAFPLIQKLKPDIVITDIRMPFMDGLVLSRLIKKEMPWIEIIILSGYEEFEYAKESIRIGVAEYLLKPISGEELLHEINDLARKIEEKRKEQQIREQFAREMKEAYGEEEKELFQYLVTGRKNAAELLELARRLELDLSAIWYNIALIKVQSPNQAYDAYSGSVLEIEEKFSLLQKDYTKKILTFDRNLEGWAVLFKADSKEELYRLQDDFFREMKEILAGYNDIRYFGGVGTAVNRLGELPISFENASHAFAHRYLMPESRILFYEELDQKNNPEKEAFDIGNIDPGQINKSKIKEFLRIGDKGEIIYFAEEFFKALGDNVLKSNIFRQYIAMDVYFCVADFLDGLQIGREAIEPPNASAGFLQTGEGTMDYIVDMIRTALEFREKKASNRYGDIVQEVKDYIEQNYGDEESSLNLLASHVNFSPNHLSAIFSQQTGQPLIKYLTDFRMNKAKELLRCTGKKSSMVSLEVGYRDPHYFSYLFKKTQGITPTQYRSGKTGEGEEINEGKD